ncbi:hypothetical protein C8R47DRAFT_506168 [Mycena vitilis]|nr:hypothetical protein C8R47DRAFT_506168 [Mycena vitilis]
MATPGGVPPGFQIAQVSGPLIVAYLLHWGLFGALTVQVSFPNDAKGTKRLVYVVYCLELVQTILVSYDAFRNFGYGFGDIEALTAVDFNWLNVPVMTAFIAGIGQFFYAYRIHILSGSWIVPAVISVTSLTSSTGAIVTGVFVFVAPDLTRIDNYRINVTTGVWCGASAACDIIIAMSMTYYLTKSDTAYKQTRLLISRLIRLSIETGTITALVAFCDLLLFYVFPGRTYYATPAALMPKIYGVTILAVLNSRFRIVGGRTPSSDTVAISSSNVMSLDFRRPGGHIGTTVNASDTYNASNDYSQSTSGVVITKDVLARYEGAEM